jgi:hypothetical protein
MGLPCQMLFYLKKHKHTSVREKKDIKNLNRKYRTVQYWSARQYMTIPVPDSEVSQDVCRFYFYFYG